MFSKTAISVLERRYLKKNEHGECIETPEQMFERVAENIALAEKKFNPNISIKELRKIAREFYDLMNNLEFLPNSPTLMNAGRELQQLSACFVLPVEDSIEGIFDAVKYSAIIHKTGGGTGFSFSKIRPKDDNVSTTHGVASGPVSFMSIFNTATETIKQGGTRRGANMGILRIDHPDIIDFIKCKDDMVSFTNFNISVAITDEFMQALENNREYALIHPRTNAVVKKINAQEVFDLICKMSWKNGDPGVIFIDTINKFNPLKKIGLIESTNPCGEQPLLPFESCNLGSLNLSTIVEKKKINFEKLERITRSAVRFLDNVIEMNNYPLKQIADMTLANRKIGLGVMGFADMLIKLEIPYASEQAITKGEEVMAFIKKIATDQSSELAKERGNFPNYSKSIFAETKQPMRNATVTTIAPTGTISLIAGVSSGIEPVYALSYTRTIMDNTKFTEIHPLLLDYSKKRALLEPKVLDILTKSGSIANIPNISDDKKKIFATALEIPFEWHIKIQAAFQKYTDNAVSKTINFVSSATEDDIKQAYLLAYKLGCKGLTIYRDGSRAGQVLTAGDAAASKVSYNTPTFTDDGKVIPMKRPDVLFGKTKKMITGCGIMYVTINEDEYGNMFEIFVHLGKTGGCASSQAQALGRMVSLALRAGVKPEEIIKQLIGISCHLRSGLGDKAIYSCADAIAKALALNINEKTKKYKTEGEVYNSFELKLNSENEKNAEESSGSCPECGGIVEHQGGCSVCVVCGYSRCS